MRRALTAVLALGRARRALAAVLALGASSGALLVGACVSDDSTIGPSADGGADGAQASDAPGANADGALGDAGSQVDASTDANAGPPGDPVALTVGYDHACVLRRDSKVICWGGNSYGQLGTNVTGAVSGPVELAIPSASPAIVPTAVVAGTYVTCIEDAHQRIYCVGANFFNQLGNGGDRVPAQSSNLTSVVVADGGGAFLAKSGAPSLVFGSQAGTGCALNPGNDLLCWGDNVYLQNGHPGQDGGGSVAEHANFGLPVLAAATGGTQTCVVENSTGVPRIACLGDNQFGELGVPAAPSGMTPAYPDLGALDASSFTSLAAGSGHACVLDQASRLICWGTDTMGQSGVAATTSVVPTVDDEFTNPMNPLVQLSLGYHLTCGVVASGDVFCLGENTHAQLSGLVGQDGNPHPSRVKVRAIDDAVSVGAGAYFACALRKSDGAGGGPSVFCWGDNGSAQLGALDAGMQTRINDAAALTSYDPLKVPL